LGTSATVDIVLTDTAGRASRSFPSATEPGKTNTFYIFSSKQDVAGEIKLNVFGGKKIDHAGIRVELKGVVGECNQKTTTPPNPTPHSKGPSLLGTPALHY
jgi:hypothetical protein